MTGMIPFNRRRPLLNTGFEDFQNVLDGFFSDDWLPARHLLRDTFKIDVSENEEGYLIEAELPGVKKDEISLDVENQNLCISVNREESTAHDGYIHRERRAVSMSRSIRLANARLNDVKAKLADGVLCVTVPKQDKAKNSFKVDIE